MRGQASNSKFISHNHFPFRVFVPGLIWLLFAFPGRLYVDVATALQKISQGELITNWTLPYYFFLKISSLNGNTILLTSFVHVMLLQYAVAYCYRSLFPGSLHLNRNVMLLNSTPFVSLFAITNTKDVFFAIAILCSIGLISSLLLSGRPSQLNFWLLAIAGLGFSFSNIGFPISLCVFLVLVFISQKGRSVLVALPSILITIVVLMFPSLSAPTFLGLSSFMGDVKCAIQNPNNAFSTQTLSDLQDFGPISKWKELTTCRSSDYSFFAAESVNENPLKFLTLWTNVLEEAPYSVFMARIQRASNFLPPVFFQGPSNSFESDYSLPVGIGSSDQSLLVAPQLFYPGQPLPSDRVFQLVEGSRLLTVLELPVIVLAFTFNQHSSLLGWTGLWLAVGILGLCIKGHKVRFALLIALPNIVNHVVLFFLAPAPEPRYAMASIMFSLIVVLGLLEGRRFSRAT